MLGRIVALSATLEYRVLSFYQRLVRRGQDAFIELSVSRVIRGARKEPHRLDDPGGRTFGWRQSQKKGGNRDDHRGGDLDEMGADLDRLVAFLEVNYQHRVYGLVSSGRHIAATPAEA